MHPYIFQVGDRIIADICGQLIGGTVQCPDLEALVGAKQQGAEFAYSRDRVWRIEFLADNGQLICCHRDQCQAVGGAA